VKDVKDELREGDQVLVKVLSMDGNRIKLSRKAILKEQRAKMGLPEPEAEQGHDMHASADHGERGGRGDRGERGDRGDRGDRGRPARPHQEASPAHPSHPAHPAHPAQPASNAPTIMIESDDEFEESDGADIEGEDDGAEPNFNTEEHSQAGTPGEPQAQRPAGNPGQRPGGGAGRGRRRRGGGGGGGRRGPGGRS